MCSKTIGSSRVRFCAARSNSIQGLLVFALAIIDPAQAVEIRAVIRIQLERAADHLFRFIEVKLCSAHMNPM